MNRKDIINSIINSMLITSDIYKNDISKDLEKLTTGTLLAILGNMMPVEFNTKIAATEEK